ncbi:MAG: enoyl-CoA hydratase/isomerase family protein [Burkholderiaceae bacterium]
MNLQIEHHGAVTLFVIDNPARRNAISQATALALQQAFAEFDESDQRVAVITGRGDEAFTAGADLNDVPEFWRCTPGIGIETDKPIIAATAGWCIGGGITLVAMSDLAVAADNTRFSYPEGRVGLTQGFIAGLAARIPQKIAMELILLGRTIDARRAYEAGLVNDVVPVGQQVTAALDMASRLAGHAPLVLRALKRFVRQTLPCSPAEAAIRTSQMISAIGASEDFAEGRRAMREGRAPEFRGR